MGRAVLLLTPRLATLYLSLQKNKTSGDRGKPFPQCLRYSFSLADNFLKSPQYLRLQGSRELSGNFPVKVDMHLDISFILMYLKAVVCLLRLKIEEAAENF
jgi:hypothetical protein